MASTGWRPGPIPPRRWGLAGPLAVLAAVTIVVGSCGAVPPTSPPAASPAVPPTPSGAVTPAPASPPIPAPSPSASPEAWSAVAVTDMPRPASLKPTRSGQGGVARDTAFVLTSLDGRPAEELASRIVASPAIAFKVKATGATAILTPASRLAPSTVYRLSLQRADGTTEAAWSARTASPLAVTGTIPGPNATGVPIDAGVEVQFNQYGVTAAALRSHFTISPAVAGKFTVAGSSVAFVPASPLKKSTLYTVTIRHGLAVDGTGEALDTDVVARFETAGTAQTAVRVWFTGALWDASARERPAIGVNGFAPEGSELPRSLDVTVHRLATLDAAIAGWRAVQATPTWTEVSRTEAVATARLPKVLTARVQVRKIEDGSFGSWFALPKPLPVGWYVVTERFGGIPRQTILQVTDTAVYSLVSITGTALWVNDLATGRPVAGATATLEGVRLQGRTDSRGLLIARTAAAVASGAVPVPLLVVSAAGRRSFHEVKVAGFCGKCEIQLGTADLTSPWWSAVTTDRYQYRSTDTVNAYGILRRRADDSVPASVTVSIWTESAASQGGVPITSVKTAPDSRGMYRAQLHLAGLPSGYYRLLVDSGASRVAETWLQVAVIRKPAYSLGVSTEHRAYIEGQTIHASATAAFFEGTPVGGMDLTVALEDSESNRAQVTTDVHGKATGDLIAVGYPGEQRQSRSVRVWPTMPEEANLNAEQQVVIFQGSAYITAQGSATAKQVVVTGSVNDIVFDRFDAPGANLWDVDPRGAPRANVLVSAEGTATVVTTVKSGSVYDFVTKRVVPTYKTSQAEVTIAASSARTGANGTFRMTIAPVKNAASYRVILGVTDPEGRHVTTEVWVEASAPITAPDSSWLTRADRAPDDHGMTYSVGDTVRVKFVGGNPKPTTSRYLFAVLQEGLRSAAVTTSATFQTRFKEQSVPSITIMAVKFNGVGYDVAGRIEASTRLEDHEVRVSVTPDRTRYEPGDTARVTISTVGPNGRPTAATVFVQAVDQKLYAIGASREDDLRSELYHPVDAGVLGSAVSHRTPIQALGPQGGDTTGGGGDGRADFRDWLIATTVTTNAQGLATLEIPLADDITSWRVTASAVDARRSIGTGTALLAVGLPFFADAIIAPEYLASDRPSITVRSFGTALRATDDVTFTVSSDTLPMAAATVHAKGFASATVELPGLSVGTHRVTVAATVGSGATRLSDTMTRSFTVVASRTTATRVTWTVLAGATPVQAGPTLTTVTLADAGRGRVIPVLQSLAAPDATRADRVLAWSLAGRTLASSFGLTGSPAVPAGTLSNFTTDWRLSVVPWGGPDLDVSVLAAMARDPEVDGAHLASSLRETAFSAKETRERRLLALAGMAALNEPVLGDVRAAAAQKDLTVPEQINVALAAWFAGDEELAGSFERQVLGEHGRTFAGQVRVDAGPAMDTTVATARLAIVAASMGDPLAAGMDAYVADHPAAATIVDLERALAARGWAERVPGATATASVTVDGQSRTVTLKPGTPVELLLTPAQASGAQITPTSGAVLAVQRWDAPLDVAGLDRSNGISIVRSVEPAGKVDQARTVVVTMTVQLGTADRSRGWRVVDFAPSGLLPVEANGPGIDAEAAVADTERYLFPARIDGQRVEFSLGYSRKQDTYYLRYLARVVTAGTYTWEPAVLQSNADPAAGAATAPATITITSAPG